MSKIKLLNTSDNSYFENNRIDIADSIPTSGDYSVGDIIIKQTQIPGTAIGWICVQSGNPGVWSEFGGMIPPDIKITLDPESVGMLELNSEVKAKLMLIEALNTNVNSINSELNTFATKEDLENIDITETVGKLEELKTGNKTNIVNAINEIQDSLGDLTSEDIGELEELKTEDKSNLVGAVNEIHGSLEELGEIEELKTEDKSSIVSAMNELFMMLNQSSPEAVEIINNLIDKL